MNPRFSLSDPNQRLSAPFQPTKKNADGTKMKTDKTKNVMRDLHIRKLCLNICVGESGDRLTRAAKVQ